MILRQLCLVSVVAALAASLSISDSAFAKTIRGHVEATSPAGQPMTLTMTIDDAETRFELTGPDYSWFAFGFDTMTMLGYSLIVEGVNGDRTVVEQNLQGIGSPGSPQPIQNISIEDTIHDDLNNLSTVIVERLNNTGDADDPIFNTNLQSLDIIWAHDSFATPANPSPNLTYHGFGGRGFDTITFVEVPEPSSLLLLAIALGLTVGNARRRPK
jgi:hypothetical protein